ncbi:hypothetical protein [Anaerosacchariphilus polymeriproducens]|uniref:Uncharacterized protein n=1 Tax=Anaerosacchariphilus polymeriproducens TaxID=1812858 RepID=A0A371AQP9_9FIRM|nr:hypothetical protein [Anaerosacchariphilus polymeriproducens]RDU21864.1 hypothetical protein DWV06_17945 [Anaerosacchariphilus polymeriproducens]
MGIESSGEPEPEGSYVCFYDIANNTELTNLRITRNSRKAGGVGITNYTKNGKEYYCLAVLDNANVDVYESNKPLTDPACSFGEPICSFNFNNIPNGQDDYSGINLVTDQNQNIFFMAYRSEMINYIVEKGPCDDYLDLYRLNCSGGTTLCEQIASRR